MKTIFRKTLTLLFLATFLIGCKQEEKQENDLVVKESNEKVEYSRIYPFTGTSSKDIFTVNLKGSKPEDMVIDFSIQNEQKKVIYNVNIKGLDLLGSTDPNLDLRLKEDQITFIKNIAKDFLNEEHFLEPAVMPEQEIDDYTPDPKFFEELRKNGLNGFMYRLGKENKYYIAYSISENKVKVYYNCC